MIRLIINPIAGIGNGKTISDKAMAILREKELPFEYRYTEKSGDGTQLARQAVEDGIETVIACGGDGTISEIACGLVHSKTALGVIPCGTGNDFIKAAHLPTDVEKALEVILTHPATPIDSGLMNDRFFLNVAGGGYDVTTLEFAASAKKYLKGILPYLIGVIRSTAGFKPFDMTIRVDGKDVSRPGLICAVGNGTNIGGGMPILPNAKIDDGLFDVIVVDAVPRAKIVRNLPNLLNGTLWQKPFSHNYRAKNVFLRFPDMKIELDGEIIPVKEALFQIQEKSLLLHR